MEKKNVYLALVLGGGVMFFGGRVTARSGSLSQKTQDHLSTAMHGEAFAHAKYLLYAHQARQHGDIELANLFRRTADTERFEHFAAEARLAGLVETDAENLRDAINGETYDVDTMYRVFAEQAAAAGDKVVADRFEEIRRDERKHRDAFKTALVKIESNSPSGH